MPKIVSPGDVLNVEKYLESLGVARPVLVTEIITDLLGLTVQDEEQPQSTGSGSEPFGFTA